MNYDIEQFIKNISIDTCLLKEMAPYEVNVTQRKKKLNNTSTSNSNVYLTVDRYNELSMMIMKLNTKLTTIKLTDTKKVEVIFTGNKKSIN